MSKEIKSRNNLYELINRDSNNLSYGIEIGVDCGSFSKILINYFNFSKLYLLDTWKYFDDGTYNCSCNKKQEEQDEKYKKVLDFSYKYGDRIEVIRGDSTVEHKKFPDEYFDFIYIDANHEYEYVRNDIDNWYPKLKYGGVFSGHDYFDGKTKHGLFGVKSAVDNFCIKNSINLCIINEVTKTQKSWYWIK